MPPLRPPRTGAGLGCKKQMEDQIGALNCRDSKGLLACFITGNGHEHDDISIRDDRLDLAARLLFCMNYRGTKLGC